MDFFSFLRERIGMTRTLEIVPWEIIMRLKYWLIWFCLNFEQVWVQERVVSIASYCMSSLGN